MTAYYTWRPIEVLGILNRSNLPELELKIANQIYQTAHFVAKALNSVEFLKKSNLYSDEGNDPKSILFQIRLLGASKDLTAHEPLYYLTCAILREIIDRLTQRFQNGLKELEKVSDWGMPDFNFFRPLSAGQLLSECKNKYHEITGDEPVIILDNALRRKHSEKIERVVRPEDLQGLEDHRSLAVETILEIIRQKYERNIGEEQEANPEGHEETLLPPQPEVPQPGRWFPSHFLAAGPNARVDAQPATWDHPLPPPGSAEFVPPLRPGGHGTEGEEEPRRSERRRLKGTMAAAKKLFHRKPSKFASSSGMERTSFTRPHSPFEGLIGEPKDSSSGGLSGSGQGFKDTYKPLQPTALNPSPILTSTRDPLPPNYEDFDWEEFDFRTRDAVYNPDIDQMVDTLHNWAMANPGKQLPANYNSFLLHAIEAYWNSKKHLEAEQKGRQSDLQKWEAEKEAYEAEVKRLCELIKERGGLGLMVAASQGSLLRKGERTEASGETAEKGIAGNDNKGKGNQRDTSRKLRRNTWKQDVRISRLFATAPGPTELPAGTVPLGRHTAGFDELYRRHKGIPMSPTPSAEAPEDEDLELVRRRLLLSEFLPSSTEPSESGKEPDVSVQTSQEGNETVVAIEGLTEGNAQSGTPLLSEHERSLASNNSRFSRSVRLPGIGQPRRDLVDTMSSTIVHSHLPGSSTPLSGRGGPSFERGSGQREQGRMLIKNAHGRYRGFSFTPGDDVGPSHPQSLLPAHSDETHGDPNDGNGGHLTEVVSAGLHHPITEPIPIPGREVTSKVPALTLPTGYRVRPRQTPAEKSEQIHGQATTSSSSAVTTAQKVSSDKKETGRVPGQHAEGHRVDFSAIAAARAFSGASTRTPSFSSQTQSKGYGPAQSVGRTTGAIAGRQATSIAIDQQGRANHPLGGFPAITSGAAEGMSIMDTSSSSSLKKIEEPAIIPEEEETAPSQSQHRVRFAFH